METLIFISLKKSEFLNQKFVNFCLFCDKVEFILRQSTLLSTFLTIFFAINRKFLEFCGIPTVIPLTLDGELIEQSIIDVISGYKMVREG